MHFIHSKSQHWRHLQVSPSLADGVDGQVLQVLADCQVFRKVSFDLHLSLCRYSACACVREYASTGSYCRPVLQGVTNTGQAISKSCLPLQAAKLSSCCLSLAVASRKNLIGTQVSVRHTQLLNFSTRLMLSAPLRWPPFHFHSHRHSTADEERRRWQHFRMHYNRLKIGSSQPSAQAVRWCGKAGGGCTTSHALPPAPSPPFCLPSPTASPPALSKRQQVDWTRRKANQQSYLHLTTLTPSFNSCFQFGPPGRTEMISKYLPSLPVVSTRFFFSRSQAVFCISNVPFPFFFFFFTRSCC